MSRFAPCRPNTQISGEAPFSPRWALIEDADSNLPEALRLIFAEACREIREIEGRVKQVERQLEAISEQLPAVEHLRTIPGVGLLSSTALVGSSGTFDGFPPEDISPAIWVLPRGNIQAA